MHAATVSSTRTPCMRVFCRSVPVKNHSTSGSAAAVGQGGGWFWNQCELLAKRLASNGSGAVRVLAKSVGLPGGGGRPGQWIRSYHPDGLQDGRRMAPAPTDRLLAPGPSPIDRLFEPRPAPTDRLWLPGPAPRLEPADVPPFCPEARSSWPPVQALATRGVHAWFPHTTDQQRTGPMQMETVLPQLAARNWLVAARSNRPDAAGARRCGAERCSTAEELA
jgi:hypothetical protein